LLAVLVAVFLAAAGAEADGVTKITIRNKTSKKASVALMWWGNGADATGGTKGWYGVEAGESRTVTYPAHNATYVEGYMGYYAKAESLVWAGKSGNGEQGWIHPQKAFESVNGEPVSGGKEVLFRRFSVDWEKEAGGNVAATITLTAK
jgi:hypothetical protein